MKFLIKQKFKTNLLIFKKIAFIFKIKKLQIIDKNFFFIFKFKKIIWHF